jgi:hypothetical protein
MAVVETETRAASLTIEEYLHTSYRPDCDFVDGVLEERTSGGTKHGMLQMAGAIRGLLEYGDREHLAAGSG